jgi:diguanylate cyclase (GGDEF)-like protein
MAQKVLLIDDAQMIHALVAVRLAGEQIEMINAYDGQEGLRMARELQPDLILLDVEMPHPDGFEVCRRLKADAATMTIPIVFLTGVSSSSEKIQALELGATDYVTKPFDPAELRARVRATLRTKFLMDLLSKKAQIDALTGLWNRSQFQYRMEQEISLARRTGRSLSCILADIDHFKRVNDTYGHTVGDDVLRRTAAVIADVCRREDVVCRYGGEEFIVLVPSTDACGAAAHAERMRLAVRGDPMIYHGKPLAVTISLGIASVCLEGAQSPVSAGAIETLLVQTADAALYRAKENGRDRVEVSEPLVMALA